MIVDPRTNIPGTLVYVKQGNLWTQTGNKATQITIERRRPRCRAGRPTASGSTSSRPSTSSALFPGGGGAPAHYHEEVPVLTRIHPDGTGAEKLLSGAYSKGSYDWFYWIRQPRPSPDGKTMALAVRRPGPTQSDVVLQLYRPGHQEDEDGPACPRTPPLGHQDPAWRPDGKLLLYVKNGRDGPRGAPVIYRYDPATKKTAGAERARATCSRPSRRTAGTIAATQHEHASGRTSSILDARTGTEILRLTNDGRSWAPVWSPRGDAIAYMHIEGQIVDLKMIGLTGTAPDWTVKQTARRDRVRGLDGGVAAELVHPGRPAAAAERRRRRRRSRPASAARAVRGRRERRLSSTGSPRGRGHGHGPVPRPRPGSGRAAARASAATWPASRRSAGS